MEEQRQFSSIRKALRLGRIYVADVRSPGKVSPAQAADSWWVLSGFVQPGVEGHSLRGQSRNKDPDHM